MGLRRVDQHLEKIANCDDDLATARDAGNLAISDATAETEGFASPPRDGFAWNKLLLSVGASELTARGHLTQRVAHRIHTFRHVPVKGAGQCVLLT